METTIAAYVLAATLLVVIGLFHSGMKARKETMQRKRATLALRTAHAQLLAFSHSDTGTAYGFDLILASGSGAIPTAVSSDPAFQTVYRVEPPEEVMSPCSQFEERFAGAPPQFQPLRLGRRVEVEIEVNGLGQTARSRVWLADPPRELRPINPLRIATTGPTTLNPYAPPGGVDQTDFSAELLDKYDRPIEGATFQWAVIPGTGNGTIVGEEARDDRAGRTAHLRNHLVTEWGQMMVSPGELSVECLAEYRGVEVRGSVGPFTTNP